MHLVSLVTTGQNWPLVPDPSSTPTVSDAVEKAAAKSPRMSIDVELDFDEPVSISPVVIQFGPSLPIPMMPKRDVALAKAPVIEAPIADLSQPVEPRRRAPFAVGFLCLLSLAGSIAIVAMKLLP